MHAPRVHCQQPAASGTYITHLVDRSLPAKRTLAASFKESESWLGVSHLHPR